LKIAHFSDTHLGYERFSGCNQRGLNQRMVDVVDTFQKVLDDILACDPDVVIHAGDFFEKYRPENLVITTAYQRLNEFQSKRGAKPLIIVAGNHDSPKSIGVGNILRIFGDHESGSYSIPGVYVVEGSAQRITLPGFEALALPWGGEGTAKEVVPENRRNVCVLIAHGLDISLAVPNATLSVSRMNYDQWDYVALGDYHIRKSLKENVWYSGSTEFTSTNFWEEEGTPKGWNLFDSESGKTEFRRVDPVRWVRTLETIDAEGLSGQEIADQMLRNKNWDESALPVIRQKVHNCDPLARTDIPAETLNELKSCCLHYEFVAQIKRREVQEADGTVARAATLDDDWKAYAEKRSLPLGLERDEFVATGHRLLKEAAGDSSED
jgi:DNA repair exonuclease SbcCD nuclease subunit